jgi:hypothetical protein
MEYPIGQRALTETEFELLQTEAERTIIILVLMQRLY